MAINLTYDPSADPEAIEAQEADDQASYEIGEQLAQQQEQLLAGKYQNAEELEQAYIELQRKLGQNDQEKDQDSESDEDQTEEEQEESDDPYVDFLFDASNEFAENGELSAETLEVFTQMSSTELVDAYIRMQSQIEPQEAETSTVELSSGQVSEIQNAVGGEAAYQQLVGWAAENFSEGEIAAFDSAIESGNMGAIGLALQALYYRYTDAVGFEGDMIQGKAAAPMDGFRSQAEVVRAMSDPRYETDAAYRQDIFDKLDRSDIQF